MTTIQELEQNISSIKEELGKLEEKLKTFKPRVGRQMPENGDTYYFIGGTKSRACEDKWANDSYDQPRFNSYNYFKTEEEAQKEIDRRLIKAKLNDIANRLNGGQIINWDSAIQRKYYLNLDTGVSLILSFSLIDKMEGTTYCLSQDFLEVAVDEIGEQELFDYMKNN